MAIEVTADSNLVVGGKLLVDTTDASLANEVSIQDDVVVGLASAYENLAAYVGTTIEGSCTVCETSAQRAIASGSTLSGQTALFVSPGTVRSLKAGAGVSLTTDTPTNVVIVKAGLANYGSGAGVQYLLYTTD